MRVPVLAISGTIGVGKTTVSYEVRLRLRDAGVSHVLIDDEFALFHPRRESDAPGRQTSTRALAALWSVYRAAGIERVVLATVVATAADLDRIHHAIDGADVTTYQLIAPADVVAERIRRRAVPSAESWCLRRSAELNEIWERQPIDGAILIDAGDRSAADIADEIIDHSGWAY